MNTEVQEGKAERVLEIGSAHTIGKRRILAAAVAMAMALAMDEARLTLIGESNGFESLANNTLPLTFHTRRAPNHPKWKEKAGAVSFEEAHKDGGLSGRILWALMKLGRKPTHDRVLEKAGMPGELRDTHAEYQRAVESCAAQGLVQYDQNHVWLTLGVQPIRVSCTYPGCEKQAPQGKGPEEAKAEALKAGFAIAGTQAYCSDHKTLMETKPEPGTMSRAQRRKLERLQKKARRVNGTPGAVLEIENSHAL